jgi:hypothetical protein
VLAARNHPCMLPATIHLYLCASNKPLHYFLFNSILFLTAPVLTWYNNTLYQQTRSKFSDRQQLLFAGLENSVFSPDACSWCLQSHSDGSNCTPPEEILPLVKNAKLELPVGSNEPFSPQHFHFQDSYWGDDHSYPYASIYQ